MSAAIGHNNPPSTVDELRARLEADYGERVGMAQALSQRLGDATPEAIASDADAATLAGLLVDARAFATFTDSLRRQEKRPFESCTNSIDGYFRRLLLPLGAAVELARSKLNEYQGAKYRAAKQAAAAFEEPPPVARDAARLGEPGSVRVVASSRWTYDVVDFEAVPRELLVVNDGSVKARIALLKGLGRPMVIPGLELREEMVTRVRR